MTLAEKLQEAIEQEATKLWPDIKLPPFDVIAPPLEEFGDLSTALPLTLAKLTQEKSLDIANKLKKNLEKYNIEHIKKITITEPGYLNFIIDFANLSQHLLNKILQQKDDFGITKENLGNIVIEHTAVNPNKAAHIGHLRNACLGDSLARIMQANGYNVEVENYIDDLGLQVADSVVAFEYFKKDLPKDFLTSYKPYEIAEKFWEIYAKIQKIYVKKPNLLKQRDEILHQMEAGKNKVAKQIVKAIVKAHKQTFKQFGIDYDVLVYESDIIKNKLWDKLFEELKDKKLIHQAKSGENKGAWIVKFGKSDREDKILVRSNEVPTYTAKDLAYQLWKFDKKEDIAKGKKKFDKAQKVINVIDNRQSYPQAVIKHILEQLGYPDKAKHSYHLAYGVVGLSEKAFKELGHQKAISSTKKSYTMSGREGIGVMVDDILNITTKNQMVKHSSPVKIGAMIASSSIRYYMLKNRPKKDMIFDFDEVLKTDGNTGVYLQYAYARCTNILNKVPDWKYQGEKIIVPKNISSESKQLIKLLENYPQILKLAATELDPSLLADYAFELSNSFAKFYEKNPVLQSNEQLKKFRLYLVDSVKQILKNTLNLLGIIPLEKI